MSYHPCVSGCGRFLALRTVTIAASRVWAFSTLRKLSWMVHVLLQKRKKKRKGDMTISELRIDSAVSNMAESLCLCRDSAFVLAPGVALHPVESEVIEGHGEGFPRGVPHPSSVPQPVGLPLERAGTSAERGTPPVSSSPWAPPAAAPCGRLCSHAAAAAFHQAASWSRSQAGRPARPGPRQTWRQVQEALRRATQRGRRLLIGRW